MVYQTESNPREFLLQFNNSKNTIIQIPGNEVENFVHALLVWQPNKLREVVVIGSNQDPINIWTAAQLPVECIRILGDYNKLEGEPFQNRVCTQIVLSPTHYNLVPWNYLPNLQTVCFVEKFQAKFPGELQAFQRMMERAFSGRNNVEMSMNEQLFARFIPQEDRGCCCWTKAKSRIEFIDEAQADDELMHSSLLTRA
jgi:hypothetical protein